MIGYRLGRVVKSVAKAALPATKWATQQASTFTSEFMRGMTEQPQLHDTTNENYHPVEDLDKELAEAIQPELTGLAEATPEQPTRSSI
tara:strand:+ start:600 stop:863 length:264 start_codon:yes stop_codon:yes gene_type:complete